MKVTHPGKKLARLLPLGILAAVAFVLCSCNAPQASAVQCAIRVQAQVAIPNSIGVTQTYDQGGVAVAGSWLSDAGTSACPGNALNFNGTTGFGTGLYEADGVRMNANWQVVWSWANTNFSACPAFSSQHYILDSGAVFNDVCHV